MNFLGKIIYNNSNFRFNSNKYKNKFIINNNSSNSNREDHLNNKTTRSLIIIIMEITQIIINCTDLITTITKELTKGDSMMGITNNLFLLIKTSKENNNNLYQ